MDDVTVTVVVPSHNGGELTLACLDTVLPQVGPRDRVLLVDNGSWDGTAGQVRRLFGNRVEVVEVRRALGFARACNLGAARVATQAILFLNQDLLLGSGALACLKRAHLARPGSILGGILLGPEGTLVQHAGGFVGPNGITFHHGRGVPEEALILGEVVYCDYVVGALLWVCTDVFRRLGGFDERFGPAYYEEVDLCVRGQALGAQVAVVSAVRARHFEVCLTGRDTPYYHFVYHRNRLRFVMKHFPTWWLCTSFFSSERRWCRSLPKGMRPSVARAYAAALVELPRWLRQRLAAPPSFVPQEVGS